MRLAVKLCVLASGAALALAALEPRALAQSGPAISVGGLPDLDLWAVGAPAPAGVPALPRTLWRGSDASALQQIFARIPARLSSPTAQSLARRVLTSSGAAPAGENATAAAEARLEALARIGAASELAQMTSGGAAGSSGLAQMYGAQAELALGRTDDACARRIETDPPQRFALRLRAVCFALDGDGPGAGVAAQVARAAGADDPWLFGLLAPIADTSPPGRGAPAARYANVLDTTASLAAGLAAGSNPTSAASPLALHLLGVSETSPAAVRYAAAVTAVRDGVLGAEASRAAVAATLVPPTPGARVPRFGPMAEAVIAVDAAPDAAARAGAVADALRAARSPALFLGTARAFERELRAAPREPALAAHALAFAKAALVLNDAPLAARWRALVPANADAGALSALDIAIAALRADAGSASAAAAERVAAAANAAQRGQAARDLRLLSALGVSAGAAAEAFLLEAAPAGGKAADAQLLAALQAGAERDAVGETALLAGVILAPGAHTLDAESLAAVITALVQVGLPRDARAAAVESMAAGIGL